MSVRIKVIILVILFLALCAIINLIKKRSLEIKYALVWMILDIGLFLIVVIPGFIDWIAEVLGIYDVTNMVFFVGIAFALIIIFTLTMSLSRNSDRVRKLTQAIALNEYDNRMRRKQDEEKMHE